MIKGIQMESESRKSTLPVMSNQKGVVLVVSLVFLVALTAVAAALMQNSTTDMKMSGASEEKVVAVQELISAVDEVIFNQVAPGQDNIFSRPIVGEDNFPVEDQDELLPGTVTKSAARVDVVNNVYNLPVSCPRAIDASSEFYCNTFRVTVNRNYGRTGQSAISADSGITQQLIP